MTSQPRKLKGRGSQIDPPNRFLREHTEADLEHLPPDEAAEVAASPPKTEYLPNQTKSIVSRNDSPDIPFRWSLNPYRGCSHGCSYCYARPSHEYLGFSAGLDFETKIVVKHDAAAAFRDFLNKPSWLVEPIILSGVTDCYQPAEREFRLTRSLLQVALEARQPLALITKNALVTRDLDLLTEMATRRLIHVALSITTLQSELSRTMEPRTSTPAARLRAIRELNRAGVPVAAMVAPVIPGLTDNEIPAILEAAADAGARRASYVMLRLPATVRPVFLEWLDRTQPAGRHRIEAAIRDVRGGRLNDSQFGTRMRGSGPLAEGIAKMFRVFAKKHRLDGEMPPLDTESFEPPRPRSGQLRLF